MKSNFLYLIRLRSNWQRSSISPAEHGLTGQRPSRLAVGSWDGSRFLVKITHLCGGPYRDQRTGERGMER